MQAKQLSPAPQLRPVYQNESLAAFRERLSDTTLQKFSSRLKQIIAVLDSEDPNTPVRQYVAERGTEKVFSGMVGDLYVSFTFDEKGGKI